jgi:hypothetical protein
MELERQVCSLQLAQKLKALGVKEGSYFRWVFMAHLKRYEVDTELGCLMRSPMEWHENWVPAYTSSELGGLLPSHFGGNRLQIDALPRGDWSVAYIEMATGDDVLAERSTSEANARATMLIYLLENKLIAL